MWTRGGWLAIAGFVVACSARNPAFDEATDGAATSTTGTDAGSGRTSGAGTEGGTAVADTGPGSASAVDDATGPAGSDTGGTTGGMVDLCIPPTECLAPSAYLEGECDPYAQDCPMGFKCIPAVNGDVFNTTECVQLMGEVFGPGQPCKVDGEPGMLLDSCDLGSICWAPDAAGNGVCVALCSCGPEQPVCDDGGPCFQAGNGAVALCTDPCDPLLQDCAHDSQVCVLTTAPSGGFVTGCMPAAANGAAVGDSCTALNQCPPGSICAAADASLCAGIACCVELCDPLAPMGCSRVGAQCATLLDENAVECGSDFGVCL